MGGEEACGGEERPGGGEGRGKAHSNCSLVTGDPHCGRHCLNAFLSHLNRNVFYVI
jgi:hypothetical protein